MATSAGLRSITVIGSGANSQTHLSCPGKTNPEGISNYFLQTFIKFLIILITEQKNDNEESFPNPSAIPTSNFYLSMIRTFNFQCGYF